MHNKSFTADHSVTVVGGRNLADSYFAVGEEPHFVDFDVIAAGPAAQEVTAMFERFWYSPSSIPIQALKSKHPSPAQVAEMRATLAERVKAITNLPVFKASGAHDTADGLRRHDLRLEWGPVRLVRDLPEKATTDPHDPSTHLLPELRKMVNGATNELLVVSPYFVPGEKGVLLFRSLRGRGVRVVALSNSLAANDVTAVHTGYRRYRKPLLSAGVELWEIKPNVEVRAAERQHAAAPQSKGGPPGSSLHAKSSIVDRQTLFIGSFNFSPRSAYLNTEMRLIIQIPKLARTVAQALEEKLPESAYRLELVSGSGCNKSGRLVWLSQENGGEVRYTCEPHATFSQHSKVFLLSFLPIESQLWITVRNQAFAACRGG
jgi:putative cardiolipin synthase